MTSWLVPQRTNTILYCERWAETAVFYQDELNLPITFANDWFIEFQLTDTSFLSIANAARATVAGVQGQGITLTWQVADVAVARAELTARGIAVTPIKQKWGSPVCYCVDPEGHRLELWQAGAEQDA